MTDWDAFLTVHRGVLRQGPGLAEDVAWAAHLAEVPRDGRLCDAGCGTGADLAALRACVPEGRVDGFDQIEDFVTGANDRFSDDPGVFVVQASMARPGGPYDLIWSAGAVYFLGVGAALSAWRDALTDAGCVAFSQPVFWSGSPSEAARAFWGEDPCGTDAETRAEIAAAGFGILGARRVTDDGWNAYFGPLLAYCDVLEEAGTNEVLAEAIAKTRAEAAGWRAVKDETGYMLYVVRPI